MARKKIRIEIQGLGVFESYEDPLEDMPCFRCAFRGKALTGCGIQGLCEKYLSKHAYFVKIDFDRILAEDNAELERLRMGMPPRTVVSDDSEFNND